MQRYLRLLKPDKFEDLIAMNALYRPALEYIPKFINRKHGKEKIEYDLPEMEEYLKDIWNNCLSRAGHALSQSLAGFSKDADILRKAMGKNKVLLDELKETTAVKTTTPLKKFKNLDRLGVFCCLRF